LLRLLLDEIALRSLRSEQWPCSEVDSPESVRFELTTAVKACRISILVTLPSPISDPNSHNFDYQHQRLNAHDLAPANCAFLHRPDSDHDVGSSKRCSLFGLSNVVCCRHVANRGHVDVMEYRMVTFSTTVNPVERRDATPPGSRREEPMAAELPGCLGHLVINQGGGDGFCTSWSPHPPSAAIVKPVSSLSH
jgi:hypothetical protein